jgi:chromate transport protein ChrA
MNDLPPGYSAKEREYELAMAAYRVARELGGPAAVGIAAAIGWTVHWAVGAPPWLAFAPAAPLAYWLIMGPYHRRKRMASEAWHAEITAVTTQREPSSLD